MLFFLSKGPVGHAIYRGNARGAWNAKFHVQTILSEPNFLGCINNQFFLPMMLRFESSTIKYDFEKAKKEDFEGQVDFTLKRERAGIACYLCIK